MFDNHLQESKIDFSLFEQENLLTNPEGDQPADISIPFSSPITLELFSNNKVNLPKEDLDMLFKKHSQKFEVLAKRINDYDSSIMSNNISHNIKDESLKLELKIQKKDQELKKVEDQIQLLRLLDLEYDKPRLEGLEDLKIKLIDEIKDLKLQYKNLGIMYGITEMLSDIFEKTSKEKEVITKIKNYLNELLSFIPFAQKHNNIKQELEKLMLIEKNLKELSANKNIPLGENDENFKVYSQFVKKANQLNKRISTMVEDSQQHKPTFKSISENIRKLSSNIRSSFVS